MAPVNTFNTELFREIPWFLVEIFEISKCHNSLIFWATTNLNLFLEFSWALLYVARVKREGTYFFRRFYKAPNEVLIEIELMQIFCKNCKWKITSEFKVHYFSINFNRICSSMDTRITGLTSLGIMFFGERLEKNDDRISSLEKLWKP